MDPIVRIQPRSADLGDGMLVRRALPNRQQRMVGAWCFLDHAGPVRFEPGKGMHVGAHPHIGLQTFTWLIERSCTATAWATSRSSAPARSI